MTRYLTIHVRAHEGRYHGDGDELPSPFRLFQALVAGAGISGPLDDGTKQALTWLEELPDAPIIASPRMVRGQAVTMFMPNNDLRQVRRRCSEHRQDARCPEGVEATPFRCGGALDLCVAFRRGWGAHADDDLRALRKALPARAWGRYGLGLGRGPRRSRAGCEARRVQRNRSATECGDGLLLACPKKGSFESLEHRYRAPRFPTEGGRTRASSNSRSQAIDRSRTRALLFATSSSFDLQLTRSVVWRGHSKVRRRSSWRRAKQLARRLSAAMPNRLHDVDRHLVGRKPDGSNAAPADSRVRIIPIPPIGMHYADRAIRRLLVEIPAACPLRSEDVRWGFSGAELFDPDDRRGEGRRPVTIGDDDMLRHYGVGAGRECSGLSRQLRCQRRPSAGASSQLESRRGQARSGARRGDFGSESCSGSGAPSCGRARSSREHSSAARAVRRSGVTRRAVRRGNSIREGASLARRDRVRCAGRGPAVDR